MTPLAWGLLAGAAVGILIGFPLRWAVSRIGRPRFRAHGFEIDVPVGAEIYRCRVTPLARLVPQWGAGPQPDYDVWERWRRVATAAAKVHLDPRTSKAAKVAAGLALTQKVPSSGGKATHVSRSDGRKE